MTGYLDNAATTKPCPQCVAAVTEMLSNNFGNPSSLHHMGLAAHMAVEQAREAVAVSLGAGDKNEIVFTSGGTEANNLALFGSAYANRRKGNRIVLTAIEHESVLETAQQLEKEGFEAVYIQPDTSGLITAAQLEQAIDKNTILVSMMLVNNEVGSALPVAAIRKIVRRKEAPANIHVDAVQAYGKIPVKVRRLDVDLLTVTAHKIHGPKGVGALYIKKDTPLLCRAFGGAQERKIRPGTESAPMIAGFGAAVKAMPDFIDTEQAVRQLNETMRASLQGMEGILINSPDTASPYILNLAVQGIRSQTLIQFLSQKEVCVSNGSACAKGKKSHVLTAMGIGADRIDSSIRVSFSRYSTQADVQLFLTALREGMAKLARK